ncbi:hypothetical protein ACUNWD_05960 [Sunxiuqinia sp. A32]|uniref:hypothetical protein n=1 Tax=Sunxiuqinia sp. A32 TaxID=3461496 RepID=UPI0040463228
MKTFLLSSLLLISVLYTTQLKAQSYGNYDKVPFAISLVPPISTNGTNAGNCINKFSLNLIAGYSAGLSGIEFAGFSNTERDFVRGAQFAGFGNFVNGDFTGFQYAGFANFNKGISRGFQFSGFANFNYAEANGVLAAGFANFTNGKSLAIQLAGFTNFCEDVQGTQLAGFANVVKGSGKVVQLAGFTNITLGEVNGVQAAGFLNISKQRMQKLQLAGFANVSGGDLEGAQIAGFLNVAKDVNGVQIGFINIADSIKSGIPIGFLSIVKNGFREFEISFGETLNTEAAFKIGVDQFYNIFAVGTQFLGSDFNWGFAYGIGTHLMKKENSKIQLELMDYHINEGKGWTDNLNELYQAKITFTKRVNEHFGFFAGPTVNLMISDNYLRGDAFESNFAPYEVISHKGIHTSLKGWIGLTAGLKIN